MKQKELHKFYFLNAIPVLQIIISIQAKRKFKQNLCNNPENSKFMLTTHKHFYGMKAQIDNAEHINDNHSVFWFFGSRIQTTSIVMLWNQSVAFKMYEWMTTLFKHDKISVQ